MTPIILNLKGTELSLTSTAGGVAFDLLPDGSKEITAWTLRDSHDAFLVLDRDGSGTIDNGRELFGNATVQPPTERRNGFNALAPFDVNDDSKIDNRDPIYKLLQLWTDRNHNGESEPTELEYIAAAGVVAIGLKYEETARVDRHGNIFKYVAPITIRDGRKIIQGQAWDVVLVSGSK